MRGVNLIAIVSSPLTSDETLGHCKPSSCERVNLRIVSDGVRRINKPICACSLVGGNQSPFAFAVNPKDVLPQGWMALWRVCGPKNGRVDHAISELYPSMPIP